MIIASAKDVIYANLTSNDRQEVDIDEQYEIDIF